MTKEMTITYQDSDEDFLISLFKKLKIAVKPKDTKVQVFIADAIERGEWGLMVEEEKEEYVLGAMIVSGDRTVSTSTEDYLTELKARCK